MTDSPSIHSAEFADTAWRKSSYTANANQCVEVAETATVVGIRDSKNVQIPAARASRAAWSAFVNAVATEALVGER